MKTAEYTQTQEAFGKKYFPELPESMMKETYGKNFMGIITVLSDLQREIDFGVAHKEHYVQALNDIKSVLMNSNKEVK